MRRRVAALAGLLLVAASVGACSSQKAGWNAEPAPGIEVSRQGGAEPVVLFARGGHPPKTLVIKDAVIGKGPAVNADSSVYIAYMGVVTSTAETIYSSWRIGHGVSIAMNKTPPAWQKGMIGMKPGGTRIIIAPPNLLGATTDSPQYKAGPVVYVISLVSVS
jgi:peptidylprolyl isomerase